MGPMFSVLVPRLLSEWLGWHMGPLSPTSDGQVGYLFPRAWCWEPGQLLSSLASSSAECVAAFCLSPVGL